MKNPFIYRVFPVAMMIAKRDVCTMKEMNFQPCGNRFKLFNPLPKIPTCLYCTANAGFGYLRTSFKKTIVMHITKQKTWQVIETAMAAYLLVSSCMKPGGKEQGRSATLYGNRAHTIKPAAPGVLISNSLSYKFP